MDVKQGLVPNGPVSDRFAWEIGNEFRSLQRIAQCAVLGGRNLVRLQCYHRAGTTGRSVPQALLCLA
jgi:hypothetical protein